MQSIGKMTKFGVRKKRKLIIKKSYLVLMLLVLILMNILYHPNRLYSTMFGEAPSRKENSHPLAKKKRMDCEGFPDWPLPPEIALYDDRVGSPRCNPVDSSFRWILHQTSTPARRPSVEEAKETLSHLPDGTGYIWHSNEAMCDFMRTQPLRFQALYNHLDYTAHKVDLWRYLLLHERGGFYLDDDALYLLNFNSSFVNSVDSVYMTQSNSAKAMGLINHEKKNPFGYTIYNGFLISKPCNRVLLEVAESMVRIGGPYYPKELRIWQNRTEHPDLVFWYNLKLLANAIAERAPKALNTDPKCEAGPFKCTLFERDTSFKVPFDEKFGVIVYEDDHNWTTAVFDIAQCGGQVVTQVPGGKHDAVAPANPHPTPWIPELL